METYTITLTEEEVELLMVGLSAQISEFCCSREEKEPYNALYEKLNRL